jgi:hypothetical protein
VTFFQKDVENPFTEALLAPILLLLVATKVTHATSLRFTNNLEKKIHEGVDGNEKRYRMGGSPRDEMFRGHQRKLMQVIDL